MVVLDLGCDAGHRFEAWLGSHADFQCQMEQGLLSCPLCGSLVLRKLPTAPRLNLSKLDEAGAARRGPRELGPGADPSAASVPARSQVLTPRQVVEPPDTDLLAAHHAKAQALMAELHHLARQAEDVGTAFAEEARKIHYGEADERAIRGKVQADELVSLLDEGIEVLPVPAWSPDKERLN